VLNNRVHEGIKLATARSFFYVIVNVTGLREIIKLTATRSFSTSPSIPTACTRPSSSQPLAASQRQHQR
jgi:hypothetical protein